MTDQNEEVKNEGEVVGETGAASTGATTAPEAAGEEKQAE